MLKEYTGELVFVGISILVYVLMALFDASHNFVYFAIVFGVFGLVVAWKIFENVDDQPEGNEKMMEIADSIHEGAMVFLSREYRILGYFVGAVFFPSAHRDFHAEGALDRILDGSILCDWRRLFHARGVFRNECGYDRQCPNLSGGE